MRDDSGHLKVADFGVSKLLKVAKTVKEDRPVTCEDESCMLPPFITLFSMLLISFVGSFGLKSVKFS